MTEFRDVIGTALTNTIGQRPDSVERELRQATAAFRPVLERSEREG